MVHVSTEAAVLGRDLKDIEEKGHPCPGRMPDGVTF